MLALTVALSRKPFLGRTLGPASAAPAGLEGAGLRIYYLVLMASRLPPATTQ